MVKTKRKKTYIRLSLRKIFFTLLLIFLSLLGLWFALTLIQKRQDNRSTASSRTGERSGWLGLVVLGYNQPKTMQQLRELGTPWSYSYLPTPALYSYTGDTASPMIWGCSPGNDAQYATEMKKAIDWPKSDYYIMFLNEPDDSHNLCDPKLAAQRLHNLLTQPNKKPGAKVIVAGGVNGVGDAKNPGWLKKTLVEYRKLYGTNPNIAGIHVHIYVWPGEGANWTNATPDQLLASGKGQLNSWQQFRTTDEKWLANKEFWISEMGVLTDQASESLVKNFMSSWFSHLASQSFVNRAYWFANTLFTSDTFSWRFRSSGLSKDFVKSSFFATYQSACAKYCPQLTYPVPRATDPYLPISLVNKRSTDGKYKTRLTTSLSIGDASLANSKVVGRIYAAAGTGRKALHECYFPQWDDYQLVSADTTTKPGGDFCKSSSGWQAVYKGVIGFVGAAKSSTTSLPLKECFDETNLNHHYALTDPACPGYTRTVSPTPKVTERWLYGWVLPSTTAFAPAQVVPAATPKPTVRPVVTPAPVPQPDLTLSQVSKRAKDGRYKTRVVTSKSQPDTTLGTARVLGKIYSTPGVGRVALHECYFTQWDEYIMMTSASTTRPSSFCPNTTAGWSETYKGVVGYINASKSTIMTKPFKECYDETNLNHHYAVTDPACSAYAAALSPRPSVRESWVYGWVQ